VRLTAVTDDPFLLAIGTRIGLDRFGLLLEGVHYSNASPIICRCLITKFTFSGTGTVLTTAPLPRSQAF